MQNSTFNPQNIDGFNKNSLMFYGKAVAAPAPAGATTPVDLILEDDVLITGGAVLVKGAQFGDRIYLEVVHPVAGVVATFIDGWYVQESTQKQIDLSLNYPAKLATGLTLRCKYVAINAGADREVAINYYLHKVLL